MEAGGFPDHHHPHEKKGLKMKRRKRKPGGQPGNKNAKGHGFGRPRLPDDLRRVTVSVRMPPAAAGMVKGLALKWGCSASKAIERAIAQAAETAGGGKPKGSIRVLQQNQ